MKNPYYHVWLYLFVLNFSISLIATEENEITRADCTLSVQINQNIIPQTINAAGTYCVITSLSPRSATVAPITINSDDVVLDLNNQTIEGTANNRTSGIIVNANLTNITIRNGTIFNFANNGILINNGCQNVNLENIVTSNNGNGISILGVSKCTMVNCMTFLSTANGIQIANSGTILPQNITMQNCLSLQNGINGFLFSNCLNVDLQNCIANNNQQNGFNQQLNSNRIYYTECNANSNGTIGFLISGFNTILTTCFATGNGAAGIQLNGFRHSISECESTFNANGFQINGNNHCILNSTAKGNTLTGFILTAISNQCQMRLNTSIANATGFQNNGTSNRIYGNYASDNTTANFTGIPNVIVSPTAVAAINCTANIAN